MIILLSKWCNICWTFWSYGCEWHICARLGHI